jgi:hypothetical protein
MISNATKQEIKSEKKGQQQLCPSAHLSMFTYLCRLLVLVLPQFALCAREQIVFRSVLAQVVLLHRLPQLQLVRRLAGGLLHRSNQRVSTGTDNNTRKRHKAQIT